MRCNGRGVPKDYRVAAKWWRLAAEKGLALAQNNLGMIYEMGQGVPQNNNIAVNFYKLAAEQGEGNSQVNLGTMYAQGKGIIKDYVYAHMWINIGSAKGGMNGVKWRRFIEKKMSPSQLEKAQDLARECVRKKYKGC